MIEAVSRPPVQHGCLVEVGREKSVMEVVYDKGRTA